MEQVLDIAEVVRRTGLTSRALRFYEARGLIRPLRSAAGRRFFGAGELERLTAILALKRAGFSLAAIGTMLGQPRADLGRLVSAQLEQVAARVAELAETRTLLLHIQSRIDRGEPIDVATLCSLIQKGNAMEQEQWKAVTDRYFSPDEKAEFAHTMAGVPAGFDQAAYQAQWKDLSARIEAALPLDPASAQAGAFVAEWTTLLEPFTKVATPGMMQGVTRFYDRMGEWEGEVDPGFSAKVFAFIREAAPHHRGPSVSA
ncbi:MerR family transcriptional regulator [Novosphingobium lentum]|uniref:MerR family transcriptional regulator n=1 Tax=Novosphingobium lentum TaxID=145287 RepID=UPI00082D7E3A|nr:MerR family transcriptional regulator [Novosphingobium lentum]